MTSRCRHIGEMRFGEHSSLDAASACREYGCRKPLIVLDHGLAERRLAEGILKSFAEAGLACEVYDKVLPSPDIAVIDEAAAMARGMDCDCIIGIGGGSAIDTAKAAAMLAANEGETWSYLINGGGGTFAEPSRARLILVPTTAGSGAELTALSAIFNTRNKVKDNMMADIFADLILLDPTLTVTCPPFLTYISAMDALSHSLERLTNKGSNPHGNMIAGQCIEWIAGNLPVVLKDPDNLDARGKLQLASHYCMDFTIEYMGARANLNHAVAGAIGYRYHLEHGHAVALALPATLRFMAQSGCRREELSLAAARMGLVPSDMPGTETASAIEQMNRTMKLPSLKSLGVQPEDLLECLPVILGPWRVRLNNAAAVPDEDDLRRILADMYNFS